MPQIRISTTFFLFIALFSTLIAQAGAPFSLKTQAVKYDDNGEELTGYFYWNNALTGKRPGVLVVHEWWGLNDYAKLRARKLAKLGYIAFVADMYGTGKVTKNPKQAQEWMQEITVDPELWQERAKLALAQLKQHPMVQADKVAAIGYCFGGATVLQMAYSDADVLGVVSFHGALPAPPEEMNGKIKPKVLVLHGEADSFVHPDVVANFKKKMAQAKADLDFVNYPDVRHGFTNPNASEYGIENLKYDAQADKDSWARMQTLFDELFK